MYSGSNALGYQEPAPLPSNWADRIGMNYANRVTGSILLNDSDDIKDASGHSRLSFTDTGDTVLRNAGGSAGISLSSTNNTTLAGNLTTVNVLGSGTVIKFTALPTSDPSVAGVLWVSGSTGGADGSKILVVSQG